MNLFERNVFESFTRGDEKAFEFIFNTYFKYLLNYCRQILKNDIAAEEIVETTFLNLWENRAEIQLETSLKSYLFKSVYNSCLNYIKHEHVKERYVLYLKHHIPTDESGNIITAEYPVSELIEKELEVRLEEAIQDLPDQCREVFLLSRYGKLKNDQIAERLHISVNTVRTQISRALAKLRISLSEFLPLYLLFFYDKNF